MKSTIRIDINESNLPAIIINYVPSEDVRDKMVKRFLEGFGSESSWAYFCYTGVGAPNSQASLQPIKPEDMDYQCKAMTDTVNAYHKRNS